MAKISNRIKVIFVKGYILFCFCWILFCEYIAFNVESNTKPEWRTFFFIAFGMGTVFVIIMVFLISRVDITPPKAEPIIKKINVKEYGQFKEQLFEQAIHQGYNKPYQIPGIPDIDNTMAIKTDKGAVYVLQTVWMQELNMEWLEMATDAFWEETEKYVGADKIQTQSVGLMQCVCVQRMNSAFRKYITQNVSQDYKRYQVLTAISFGGKKAYICKTKGGFYRSYYRYLKKEFETITENILENMPEKKE